MAKARRSRSYHPKRMVYVDREIDNAMTYTRQELTRLFSDDQEKPILLVMSSYGGSVDGMFTLIDRISQLRSSGARIDCLIEGYAMSAALIVAQACEQRLCGPHAMLMFHGATWGMQGDIAEHQSRHDYIDIRTDQVSALFGERTLKPAEYWRKKMKNNTARYYTADEALELGLVDEVIA